MALKKHESSYRSRLKVQIMTKESSFDLDIYMALQYNEKKLKITIGRGRRRKKKMKEFKIVARGQMQGIAIYH